MKRLVFPLLFVSIDPALAEEKPTPTFATFEYASRVDGTKPLKADIGYVADGKVKPLLVVMHGYSGSRKAVALDVKELATRGVFAVAADMRGCGDSAGKWDSGGLDVHDIADAVLTAIDKYPKEIDARNLNIVGYSGGGGNAIACMVRFPDLFRTYVSFFGISDYAGWHTSKGRPDCNERMEKALGGPPDKLPDEYLSRNAIPAAGNARVGRLHFVWDEAETACPADMIEAFVANYRKSGLDNATTHVSKKTDPVRWIHNYRSSNRDLTKADDLFLPDVLTKDAKSPRIPPTGRLVVPGYLVTRQFQVWVEDGTKGQVTVEYDVRGAKPFVTVVDNPKKYRVRIETTSPFAALP
jgi:pimeloyl-ACP methyl ester carboxylesterase